MGDYSLIMAKKVQQPVSSGKKVATPPSEISDSGASGVWLSIVIALVVTALCYWPSLKNGLVNWDDDPNILENENLQRVGKTQTPGDVFADIFSIERGAVIGNYNPLPIYTFALEKAATGGNFDEKFIRQVHLDNLLLHLVVVLFAMRVLLALGIGRWGALAAGLLMGIHPMRVESVAWATERKDVLFAAFFFMAMECYIRYVKSETTGRKVIFFTFSMLLAVLSLYSKVQAVTLVVSLLLVDYWLRRPWTIGVFVEKAPLFIASVAMGLVNIHTLTVQGSTNDITGYNILDRACIASWSLSTYLYKLLIPSPMSPMYPYPQVVPWYIYASPVIAGAFLGLIYWAWKMNYRAWVFGLLFFFLNVAPVLQFLGAGQAYLADRFTYVPYFGFFFIAGWGYEYYVKNSSNATVVSIGLGVLLSIFAYITVQQIGIWKNGETLWTHVMKEEYDKKTQKYEVSLPFWNRGQYRRQKGDYDRALSDYDQAILINPKDANLYISRGKTYFELAGNNKIAPDKRQEYLQKALTDYTVAIDKAASIPEKKAEALINRGAAYGMAQLFDQAIADLNLGIQMAPKNKNGYFNRSIAYFSMQKYDLALVDYTSYLELDPYNVDMRYEKGMLERSMGKNDAAIEDLSVAISLNPNHGLAYLERGRAYTAKGNQAAAQTDFQRAAQLGVK